MMRSKVRYLGKSTWKWATRQRLSCPSCGEHRSSVVARKFLVTSLRRCAGCELLFRAPTTSEEESRAFYQRAYHQGTTTETPSDRELVTLRESGFSGTPQSYQKYVEVLAALGLGSGLRLFEFGCSWGYGSFQLARAGYEVSAFEVSRSRAQFAAEKLAVFATSDLGDVPDQEFDIFFSAHVLEHVPSVASALALARTKLKTGGVFVAFTPNGSTAFRTVDAQGWQQLWGEVHPNFLDDRFYRKHLPGALVTSSPYDLRALEAAFQRGESLVENLGGSELLAAVRFP